MAELSKESTNMVFAQPTQTNSLSATQGQPSAPGVMGAPAPYDEQRLLTMFDALKRECMEYRWIWEREWLRDLFYVANRQWIFFHPTRREWVDKRLLKWIPRPVTNKMAETLQAIRTTLGAIQLQAIAQPTGHDTQSIAAAEVADQMAPLIHEEHLMNQVMREADFWFIATGNAVLQTSWNKDNRFNRMFVAHEQCTACGTVQPPQAVVAAGQHCIQCGGTMLQKAPPNPDGSPAGEFVSFGRGKTTALSPFEYAFPPNVTRWDDLPYIIRLRWRDKHWFEANKPELVPKITWEKSPADRSLQIFKSLALTNDVGTGSQFAYLGSAGAHTVEGVTEYELWLKPTPEFERGLVMRVIGDKSPMLLQAPEEGLPGPFPYKDIEGNPLFPFMHAQYEHMGGRLLGRSAISPLIQKQDQLNQLDSLIQLIIQRMANPVWVVPEGAGVDHFTGEPGLVMKWNPLSVGGQGKPERLAGQEVPSTLYQLREQILKDIEELSGAFDIIKGQKPQGVEAFSALQLLVERSQSRFGSAFGSRGEMYRQWYAIALELERQFGPQQRTWAVVSPNQGYTFKHFENAQLQGQVSIKIEDGSNMPKTSLGKRAAIEQANQLRLLSPEDPDQKFALLATFGLSELVPSLNTHVQSALQLQDEFEKWAETQNGPPPLVIKPWFNAQIHWNERIKWLNGDKMKEIIASNPMFEQMVVEHLQQLQMVMNPMGIMPAPGQEGEPGAPGTPPGGAPAQGGAKSMANSNQNSGSTDAVPKGNKERPNEGPAQQGPA
jgi:hypothetical protein